MRAKIIDGKKLAEKIRARLKDDFALLKKQRGELPALAVVMVGNNSSSEIYVRNKIKACEDVGIKSVSRKLPLEATQSEVEEEIKALSKSSDIAGILVQLPLPRHLNEEKILELIPVEKDVDGFSDKNMGGLVQGKEVLTACTPSGIIEMIKSENIPIAGKHAVVIGRSNIVGKPVAMLLLKENATVTICHSKTQNIKEITRTADILVAAVGKPKTVTADMVKKGAVVIDVGINRIDGKICGDVDFESVSEVADYITPVPGGVGPMTITMLLYNTYLACVKLKNNG